MTLTNRKDLSQTFVLIDNKFPTSVILIDWSGNANWKSFSFHFQVSLKLFKFGKILILPINPIFETNFLKVFNLLMSSRNQLAYDQDRNPLFKNLNFI